MLKNTAKFINVSTEFFNMNPITNNPFYIQAVYSAANGNNNPHKALEAQLQKAYNFDKQLPPDAKNTLVTEKTNENLDFNSYSYRFQQNVPVSTILSTISSFNEINKASSGNKASSKSKKYFDNYDYSTQQYNGNNTGKTTGFYIVDNNFALSPGAVSLHDELNPVKQKINKAYNVNNKYETGSLVDVVYY